MIREMELSSSDNAKRKHFPSVEESLKHLLWLSDSVAVFEAALDQERVLLLPLVQLPRRKRGT
ncbi:hypothetical protein Leryth_007465 [Lithospermum erythrorhizon]|nr:hypothetical protein Leryth_007465 [Lithospermum erythrorhizon]